MLFQINTGFSDSFLKIPCALKAKKADKQTRRTGTMADRQQHIAYSPALGAGLHQHIHPYRPNPERYPDKVRQSADGQPTKRAPRGWTAEACAARGKHGSPLS